MSIRLQGIGKGFGGVSVIRDLDLEIPEGAFFTLLGSSGSGKTTILRMIAGFEHPDAGSIRIGEVPVADAVSHAFVPPERRGLGMVFQSYALWPHRTVAGNLALGLAERGCRKAGIAAKVAEALALVGLSGLERRYPHELSGGQQQRVALARALVMEPRVLLLDEPMSNLDAALRESVRDDIRALQQRLGITALLVTHDQVEAMSVSDRIAILNGGVIAQVGTPDDVYRRPASRFVATFLGQANLLDGIAAGGRVRIGTAAVGLERAVAEGPVTLMVRPEWLSFADGPNAFPAIIRRAVLLGSMTRYEVEVPAFGATLKVDLPSRGAPAQGRVPLHVPPACLWALPAGV